MDDRALLRYARHILLDEIGIQGQERLIASRVLVIGVGGLGSPVALYLAAAGVGHISLADADQVELSNLQRQIVHTEARLGWSKVDSAAQSLSEINPHVEVHKLPSRLAHQDLIEACQSVDLVLDCTDSFASRQDINQACFVARKPLVSGSALRFSGQLSVFRHDRPGEGPCYACLFPPDQEPTETSCATMGVFAPLVGVIGTLQASEAVRILIGHPEAGATGRLLMFDALRCDWHSLKVPRDPHCPVCGINPREHRAERQDWGRPSDS